MSILVATDLSEHSKTAIRWAAALAAQRNTPLFVAHIIDTLGDDELWTALFETPDEIEERVLRHASETAQTFVLDALEGYPSPDRRGVLVAVGPPADEIERFAQQKDAELIVTGTTGHGRLRNAVFGSTAHKLTQVTARPTAFVPHEGALPPAKKIVIGLDFSECSDAALDWAATVVREWDAELIAVHAIGVSALSPDYEPSANFMPMVEALTEERRRTLDKRLSEHGLTARAVVSRAAPGEAIHEVAKAEGADLIVMGTHGRGPIGRFFLGSVALQVLRSAPCPVVTVHPTGD